MTRNMSNMDRGVRLVVAAIIAVLLLTSVVSIVKTLGIILAAVGVIFVLTSTVNFCPLYRLFGISTCKVKTN